MLLPGVHTLKHFTKQYSAAVNIRPYLTKPIHSTCLRLGFTSAALP